MMKWRCTVCQYVHEGDTPPDSCPVCGQPKEAFERIEEAADSQSAHEGPSEEVEESGRQWLCTVCGYVHSGAAPPDKCPVCQKPWSAFIPNVDGVDGPKAAANEAEASVGGKTDAPPDTARETNTSGRWRCTVCNYVHNGAAPAEVCPICGAGPDAFVPEMKSPEHHHRGFGGLIEKLHLHPVSAHFPNGALPLALLAWVAYLLFGETCLERASFYLMLVASAAVPVTAITGWSDARHRFKTTTTGVFPEKKRWSLVLIVTTLIMTGWRFAIGWSHAPEGTEIAIYSVLLVAGTALVARLGMLGGKLVFGH